MTIITSAIIIVFMLGEQIKVVKYLVQYQAIQNFMQRKVVIPYIYLVYLLVFR